MQLKITIEEWKDLRDEIKRRIDQRTRLTEIMISLVSALFSVAIATGNYFFFVVIPFASAYCLYHIKATYFIHHWLTKYIRERIEDGEYIKEKNTKGEIVERRVRDSKLRKIFPNSDELWLSWETYYKKEVDKKEKQRASRRRFYNLFQLSLYLICGTVFIWHSILLLPSLVAVCLVSLYLSLGLIAVWLAWMIDPYKKKP